jgi:hypothetical protein
MWDCHSCDPGSNPGPGADSSVRIPTSTGYHDYHYNNRNYKESINSKKETSLTVLQTNNISDKYKVAKLFENAQMRDLYNRKKKLDYWTGRIHKI